MSPATKRESSEDINALPKSESSDEEGSSPVTPTEASQLHQSISHDTRQHTPVGRTVTARECKSGLRSTRSREPRLKDEGPQLSSSPQVKSEPFLEDEPMDSWLQPNKRRRTTYADRAPRATKGFTQVPPIPHSPEREQSTSTFSVPNIKHYSPQSKARPSLKDDIIVPPAPSKETLRNQDTGPTFNMPGDALSDLTSSATSATESLQVFDLPGSPKFSTSRRSNSISSLSSVDSLASLVLTQEKKEALRRGEEEDYPLYSATARCPLCHSKVDQIHLETFNFGRRLNIRDQQRFCQEHKHHDAEKLRQEKRYPSIDWSALINDRIPKQIALLNRILTRTLPSYFRDQLDAAMEEASGRKSLQWYLTEGVVDIAKHGYYGPKGAKIMGRVITEHMSDVLKQELKKDKVARAAGVGGYVNAVLVPELAVRLVMEDMLLEDEEQARDLLSESSNVGILLNADEENITREEQDDED